MIYGYIYPVDIENNEDRVNIQLYSSSKDTIMTIWHKHATWQIVLCLQNIIDLQD